MRAHELPAPLQPTLVRKGLRWAERLRYRWEYRGRLHVLLQRVDPSGSVRLTRAERRRVHEYWDRHDLACASLSWFRLFKALTGRVDPRFIPEEVFRVQLEPMLCRRDVAPAYHDKNQLDRQFPDIGRPRTVVRNIYGNYYDGEYRPLPREAVTAQLEPGAPYFLKPAISGTGSGHNVARVEVSRDGLAIGRTVLSLADVERIYVQDFLIQQPVRQHARLAAFHPPSLNTLRMITLRLGDEIALVAATFRMGNGSHVDNGHAGGLLCGVDLADARLTPFACDVFFGRYDRHPISGEWFTDQEIPSFAAVHELARRVHSRLPYFDVVSSDIAVLEDGQPCLVEVNTLGQGVEPHQFLKGEPLFGDQTERVLTLVAQRARSGWNG
ncbi:MAG: sugar-transfer associated ATP-grasp domain-containing protein [Vicinamibacterales bacterium]